MPATTFRAPPRRCPRRVASRVTPAVLLALPLAAPGLAHAQTTPPPVIDACYVPVSGTIYRINTTTSPAPGLPANCLSAAHVRFQWNQQGVPGPAGPKGDRGDPEPPGSGGALPVYNQAFYDLAGPTATASGFVAGGVQGQGSTDLPAGTGTRLFWYPRKAAFRAGFAFGDSWDESRLGGSSVAFGAGTAASGNHSVAMGQLTTASGDNTFALGSFVSTNGQAGAMVLGDNSTTDVAGASAPNQLTGRFVGGYRFRTSQDLARGCDVSPAGRLTCTGGVQAPAFSRVRSQVYTVGRTSSRLEYQSCPAGTRVVGGGVETGQTVNDVLGYVGDMKVRASYPDYGLDAWVAEVRNDDASGQGTMRISVVCVAP